MGERVFLLPDPGEGLTEAELLAWLVAEGDEVELNQPIAEVETSKAAVEIPSPYAGRIARLHASVGDSVQVGSPLVTYEVAVDGSEGPTGGGTPPVGARATPPVRRLAKDLEVDLDTVAGTGPQGRVTAEDVRAAAGSSGGSSAQDPTSTEVPVTPTRRAIAETLERQAAIPQVTTFRTVDATAWDAYRRELQVSPLPILIAALAAVAETHPSMNAAWGGDRILLRSAVNVGLATDTERGLMVPVLRDAGRRGIRDLGEEIHRLAALTRDGRLGPADQAGATIAVSNTGTYGSESGTPILSPGTAVTLAMGAIAPRALVLDGEVVARPACTLSLTFDHRVLDGAGAGRALTDLVTALQDLDRLRDLPA
jgi:2-oxoisovalerate dehydrogenase E2 component (dihydrolipoyl transacylase)